MAYTFVLVHGAWHGGWCWQRVADRLRGGGHAVFTPTLTGLGERSHLLRAGIDLKTHIADVVNVMKWEGLSDVVLCGHSYGGMVTSGVAEALPQARPRGWIGGWWGERNRRIGGVVCFAADGSARAVSVSRWPIQWFDLLSVFVVRPSAAPLRRAWRQVFAQLCLGVEEPGRSRALAVALAMLFGWAGGHWFYLGQRRRGVVYLLCLPLLMAPMFLGFVDAFRFLWVDRAGFDARFSALRSNGPRA